MSGDDYAPAPWSEPVQPAPFHAYEGAQADRDAHWAAGHEPDDFDPEEGNPSQVIALLAEDSARAVAMFRDPDAVLGLTRHLGEQVVEQVRAAYARERANRAPVESPRITDLAPEIRMLADAADALRGVSQAVMRGVDESRAITAELLAEVEPDERRSVSGRIADGHGQELKVSRYQPTKTEVNFDEVRDVLVAVLVAHFAHAEPGHKAPSTVSVRAYATGIRDGITALLRLVSPVEFKSTALDALVKQLDASDEHDLAIRLAHAYGRPSHGDPKVAVKREETKL